VIAFLPGVNPLIAENNWLGVSARHSGNNVVPVSCFVVPISATYGGQTGTEIRLYGYSAGNTTGGAYGANGIVTFGGLSFAHS
jgi:hypothetical protein